MSTSSETIGSSTSKIEDALIEGLDKETLVGRVIQLGGYGDYEDQFRDVFDVWTPERAFAVYVLAKALEDIEPLNPEPPQDLLNRPAKLAQWFIDLDLRRDKRIIEQQSLEESLGKEGAALIRRYRAALRELWRGYNQRLPTYKRGIKNSQIYRKTRYAYERELNSFLVKYEDQNALGTSLKWFEEERAAVELWCDMAHVDIIRCYKGVQHRLGLLGRCSIKIHRILKTKPKPYHGHDKEIRTAKYEDRSWTPFNIAEDRRTKAVFLLRSISEAQIAAIKTPADRGFIQRLQQTVCKDGVAIGPKQLARLTRLVETKV